MQLMVIIDLRVQKLVDHYFHEDIANATISPYHYNKASRLIGT